MNRFFSTVALSLIAAVSTMAQDKLFIEDFTVEAGEQVDVKVNLANPESDFTAIQFDLFLPEGLEVATRPSRAGGVEALVSLNNDSNSGRLSDHTCLARKAKNGAYRFVIFSLNNTNVYEKNGDLLTITLKASEKFVSGRGLLNDIVLVKASQEKVVTEASSFKINESTGIESVTADAINDPTYNIAGERVENPTKGLYIKSGKKVLVKDKR